MFANMRYFLEIAYKGTNYHGWQLQSNASSVQEEINKAISTVLGTPINITGSGRTDTGVHASQQWAHVDLMKLNQNEFKFKLNSILPTDICIKSVHLVNKSAHARYDATKRTYRYFLHTQKNPFLQETSYFFPRVIDVSSVAESCDLIKEWKDFKSFSRVKTEVKHYECEINDISWRENNKGIHVFEISSNRFLRGMVRSLVGTLLEVGLGRLSMKELHRILKAKDRRMAGRSVPAHGLFLDSVIYPSYIFE